MFRPTRGARISMPGRTTMPGSNWNPTSTQSPQPMPRQNPGVQTTNPGGSSVMDSGAPQPPRQPSQNAQLSSGFQREQSPQAPAQQFTSSLVGNDSITPVEYFPDGRIRMSDGTIYNPNTLPTGRPMPGNQVPPIADNQPMPRTGGIGVDPQTQYQMELSAWQARRDEAAARGEMVNMVQFPPFEYWLAQRQPGGDTRGQQPPPPPMTMPSENVTYDPRRSLPQPPMRYRPAGPSPDKGMGGGMSRPQPGPAPMQTQLPGQYNPTAGTIYDRPGMGPGYGAAPPLQRMADIDYAAPQPPRRYTVRTPGVNRTTGNGIFTGR